MTIILSLCVGVLVVAFGLAGQAKLREPRPAALAMVSFGVVKRARTSLAYALGAVEFTLALGLWLTVAPLVASAIVGLLTIFVLLLSLVLKRGDSFSCGCFGSSDDIIDGWTVLRTVGFLVAGLVTLALSVGGTTTTGADRTWGVLVNTLALATLILYRRSRYLRVPSAAGTSGLAR